MQPEKHGLFALNPILSPFNARPVVKLLGSASSEWNPKPQVNCFLCAVPGKRRDHTKGRITAKGWRIAANQDKILNEGLALTPITSKS